jgi:hypothetical protein
MIISLIKGLLRRYSPPPTNPNGAPTRKPRAPKVPKAKLEQYSYDATLRFVKGIALSRIS